MSKNYLSEYHIAELIFKSITKVIDVEEQKILDNWLLEESNLALYNTIVSKKNINTKLAIYKEIEIKRVFTTLESKIATDKTKTRKLKIFKIFKYAAVLLVFLSLGYLFQNGFINKKEVFVIPNEHITLQLDNGTIKIISEDGTAKIVNSKGQVVGTQNGTQLVYGNDTNDENLVYNTLTVPYGKRFAIQLSDGTSVHLNSGTSLKYPVKFLKGHNREVFIKGEAFFKVTKDLNRPFIVNSEALNVKVLGTQFNVSSYPEDTETDVVLIEGSVNLYTSKNTENELTLKPGFKGSYSKTNDSEITSTPVITSIYTAWVDGELVFRNITFENILKKMERHYNVEIINNNQELTDEKFNASFRNEPIEKILEYFKITYDINYTINKKNILIN